MLNIREFILMSIVNNAPLLGSDCTNCYHDTISNKIDPIFEFMDCDGSNSLTTEEVCYGLKKLKKSDPTAYNMFDCLIKEVFFHSSSCNDLVVKYNKKVYGTLTKEEFRQSLLLGYWDRHTDLLKIYPADEKNNKQTRWSKDGKSDLFCEKLKAMKTE